MEDRMLSDEILLGIINSKSGGGGGGGTSNYNDLSNKPQIGGTTLTGNKSASDLGLVAAEAGKGLSANDYTDADKAIVGGVTAALSGKQNALTAGSHIAIDDDTISVNRWAVPAGKVVYTVITSDENYGQNVHVQRHTLGGALIDDRVYTVQTWQTTTVDDVISIHDTYGKYEITLLKNSDEQSAGYSYTVQPTTTPTSNSFTFVMPQEENDNDLIIREELDAVSDAVDVIKDGTNIDSFADVETALALKQDKTDNSLQTTDKTVVGAINEHEGDIDSLKSGLTNVDVALSVSDGSGVNLFIPSNYETFDLTGVGDYRYGHSFNSGEYYVVSNNTAGIYYRIVKEDLSDLGTSVSITSTPQKVTIPSGYIMWVFSNNQATLPNACVSKYSTPYVAYIPSVDARLEVVETGKQDKTDNNLTTTAKTVIGAINELDTDFSNLLANNLSGLKIKRGYKLNSSDVLKFDGGTYLFFTIKPQYSQSAIYALDDSENSPQLIAGTDLSITKTVSDGRITVSFSGSYLRFVLIRVDASVNFADEIHLSVATPTP